MNEQDIDKEIIKKLDLLNESINNITQLNTEFMVECNSTIRYIKYIIDLKNKKNVL